MTIRGTNPRFILGSYICEASRVAWNMTADKVEYSAMDQYKDEYTRKLGNRYKNAYEIFDFTADEKTLLLSYNGTRQTFTQYFDCDCDKTVYCDIYYDPVSYYPSAVIRVVLTDLDVIDEATNVYGDSGRTEIKTEGFITPDGVDDYVLPTSFIDITTATTDEFSIAFSVDVSSSSGDNTEVINTTGGTTGIKYYLKTSTGSAAAGLQMGGNLVYSLKSKAELIATAGSFVSIVYTQKKSTGYYKFYFDGVVDNGAIFGGLPTLNFTDLLLFATTANSSLTGMKFKNFVFTNDVMDATDAANHASGNISAIDNQLAWYRCNEASGNLIDSSETIYWGDFNGTDNYIDTGIAANSITSFRIKWKYNYELQKALFGAISGSGTERYYLYQSSSSTYYLLLGDGFIWNIHSYMTEDHVMELTLVHNGSLSYTLTVKDITTDTVLLNDTQSATGTIATNNLYIGARNYSTLVHCSQSIYEFEIDGEIWYFNPASSTTIKSIDGTALTVSGTVTNFFQDTYYEAVPTNVDSSFYNTDEYYEYYRRDAIVPDSIFPKIALAVSPYTEYEFSDDDGMPTADIEFEIQNDIDYEGTSITGRLHRRYTENSEGNIKQNFRFVLKRYNLDRDEYDLLKIYDGKDIKIYPDKTSSEYYEAYCSMLFLNFSDLEFIDYAEITITPRGEITT